MFAYLGLLRPKHWVKNLFLFAAPLFGGKLFLPKTLHTALFAFAAFSFCASAGYVFNDLLDLDRDLHHPKKRLRPLASGRIGRKGAALWCVFLAVLGVALSVRVGSAYLYFVLLYMAIQLVYSLRLKHIAIIDIFCIAAGFVIRVLAGGAAFKVEVSQWLFVTMFMISLVLAAGKRLGEVFLLDNEVGNHRRSLHSESVAVLNDVLIVTSAAALMSYALYVVEQFHDFIYTVPVVTFGLFRYLLLSKRGLGDPTDAMTGDRWLAATVVCWLLLVGLIRYN